MSSPAATIIFIFTLRLISAIEEERLAFNIGWTGLQDWLFILNFYSKALADKAGNHTHHRDPLNALPQPTCHISQDFLNAPHWAPPQSTTYPFRKAKKTTPHFSSSSFSICVCSNVLWCCGLYNGGQCRSFHPGALLGGCAEAQVNQSLPKLDSIHLQPERHWSQQGGEGRIQLHTPALQMNPPR